MEDLEVMLRKVDDLRGDLSAEIVVQKEEGHEETTWTREYHDSDWGGYASQDVPIKEITTYIIDQPRITKPDTQKNEAAKTQLQQIYDNSEWYSVRYQAGNALGKNVEYQFGQWIEILKTQLMAEIVQEAEVDVYHPGSSSGGDAREAIWNEPERREPDETTRENARRDLSYIYNYLPSLNHRKAAGKALGYSNFRIWLHELFR